MELNIKNKSTNQVKTVSNNIEYSIEYFYSIAVFQEKSVIVTCFFSVHGLNLPGNHEKKTITVCLKIDAK